MQRRERRFLEGHERTPGVASASVTVAQPQEIMHGTILLVRTDVSGTCVPFVFDLRKVSGSVPGGDELCLLPMFPIICFPASLTTRRQSYKGI